MLASPMLSMASLGENVGVGKNFETLAYIGPNDIGYNPLLLGAAKTGHKVCYCPAEQRTGFVFCHVILLMRNYRIDALHLPRNSIPAHSNLFNVTDCHVMLASSLRPPVVAAIVIAHPLRVLEVPTVDFRTHIIHTARPLQKPNMSH